MKHEPESNTPPNSVELRQIVVSGLFGCLFAIATMLPFWSQGKLHGSYFIIGVLFIGVVASIAFLVFGRSLQRARDRMPKQNTDYNYKPLHFVILFLVFECLFLFVLLANYPGFCSNDSNDIINQVLGTSVYNDCHRYDGLSNHHPVFYTFLIWLVFTLTSFAGDVQLSLFVFLFLQCTFVSACITWSIHWLVSHKVPRAYIGLAILFFLTSPILVPIVPILWKDVPFSFVFLIASLQIYDIATEKQISRRTAALFIATLLLLVLLRNNGLYISALLLLYMVVFVGNQRKLALCALAVIAVIFALLKGPIFMAFDIEEGHFSESIGIPLQQIGAVSAQNGDISESDRAFLENVIPLEEMGKLYKPNSPNPIKFSPHFNDAYLESNKLNFLLCWMHIVADNPTICTKAWINETFMYWSYGYTVAIGTNTSMYNSEPTSLIGVSFNPSVLSNAIRANYPFIFSEGLPTWLLVAALFLMLFSKEPRSPHARFAPLVPAIGLLITLFIAAPTLTDYRYVLPLYILIPFLPVFAGIMRPCRQKDLARHCLDATAYRMMAH